jgi:hypothetical protein
MGTAEGIIGFYFGIKHSREFTAYLLLGLLSISSGLYLVMSQAESLQMVSLIVSPHAFLFGLAELRIARQSFDRPSKPVPANGAPLSVLTLEGIPSSHRRFADDSNLIQVHSGDDLTADQITTVRVGDRERIATRAITLKARHFSCLFLWPCTIPS